MIEADDDLVPGAVPASSSSAADAATARLNRRTAPLPLAAHDSNALRTVLAFLPMHEVPTHLSFRVAQMISRRFFHSTFVL